VSIRGIGTFLRRNKHWSFHSFIDLIITKKRTQGKENKHQEINVEDIKDKIITPRKTRETRQRGKTHQKRKKKERIGSHWLTTDPRVEMAFFTSSTFTAENLNTGETEACLGNCSFSRVSFLVCT